MSFRMPNAGIASDARAKYKLRGGRLAMLEGQRLAVLSFQMPHAIFTVLVAPDTLAKAMGGSVMYSDAVQLHSADRGSMHIVTWENKSLTYALISAKAGQGVQSCGSCHEAVPSGPAGSAASAKVRGVPVTQPSSAGESRLQPFLLARRL